MIEVFDNINHDFANNLLIYHVYILEHITDKLPICIFIIKYSKLYVSKMIYLFNIAAFYAFTSILY